MGAQLLRYFRNIIVEHKVAVGIFSCSFLAYAFLLVNKYVNFAYSDWDMAFYNQSLWNLLHGRLFSELYGLNVWGAHAEFVVDLSAPLLCIFPSPVTFSIFEIALFVFSGWIFYVMADKDIGRLPALLLAIMYLFCAPNLLALCHDHNAESLSSFFIMLSVFHFRQKKLARYYCSLILLVMVKENMALIVAVLGLWGVCAKDRNRIWWGVGPLLLSLLYFFWVFEFFIPFFRGSPYNCWVRYAYLGNTKTEIFQSLLHIRTWAEAFADPSTQRWILDLFGPFLLTALLSPFILLLMLPIFCYHFLSAFAPETTLFNIYALSMMPAIFLATVNTLRKLQMSGMTKLIICSLLLAGCSYQVYEFRKEIAWKTGFLHSDDIAGRWRLVGEVPRDAAVIATFRFLPALSLRERLYSFHKVYSRDFQEEEAMKTSMFYVDQPPFIVPGQVDYALIDYRDQWLEGVMRTDGEYAARKINSFLNGWRAVDRAGSAVLYRRGTGDN